MKVLLTGACGWIGGHLIRGLTSHGHIAAGYDRRPSDSRALSTSWVGDVRDQSMVERALEHWEPDVVVHLAARYGRVWCETGKAHAFDVNVTGTAVVAEACAKFRTPFVLASSSEVYGIWRGDPKTVRGEAELHALEPLNTYGESKLMAEKVARRILSPDLLSIWRLNMPYGPGGRSGDSGVPGFGYNALHTWMWQAKHGLDLTVYRDTSRSFTFIDDVVDAMVMLLETGHRGTINVCSSQDMLTSYETATMVLTQARTSSGIIEVDPPPSVTPWKRLDDSTLYGLGWFPVVRLSDGIDRTIDYMGRFNREGRWAGEETVAATAQ